ncbi:acetolactate decarboxylase [Conexibacter sp. JD483]|uniref:acetolactate decarboxylase n=1 Tax=unclassified Conexibacter TaxID=2627773 RepID=UPI00271B8A80|nr:MULTISPECIES: acetolactate decarboxylase [unclassified Conexibacter]MDO8186799.1 acetolactate decarboxylase [Conexibacter sp. CPCC 205706]MDO8197447.1 acetolactate decarboxylase [Conexibacter sp. CPCC 205762]MDR9370462.1 acetolactate decarboxylase [Conexibacter sp. JD483]
MASAIDPRLVAALHPLAVRHGALGDERAAPRVVFQTATIAALLDGAYDGDLTIAELREHGDLGLGTFDALDGEMIVVDGEVWRARVDGTVSPVGDDECTPFAAVTPFTADVTVAVERELSWDELLALAAANSPMESGAFALRFDGALPAVHARSAPKQPRPYLPLAEAAASLRDFMLAPSDGTLVGFCFPPEAAGVELPGFHLHVITADRTRGGHVLSARVGPGTLRLGALSTLHIELPPGVELPPTGATDAAGAAVLRRIEGDARES